MNKLRSPKTPTINIHKNDGISTLKSASVSPKRAKKLISSPAGHRWRCKSSPILNKNRIFNDENDRNLNMKHNEKVKRVVTKKVSPKLGQKQAKLTEYFGERGSKNFTKEDLHEIEPTPSKTVRTNFVNFSKNSENIGHKIQKSADLKVKSGAKKSPKLTPAKKSSKVAKMVNMFESNFGQSDFSGITGEKLQITLEKQSDKKKIDAFELLMLGGRGKTPQKSKLKRIVGAKCNKGGSENKKREF